MDHKLISGLVESGCGLEHCDIGAVAKLGLRVTSQNLVLLEQRHPMGQLLLVGQHLNYRGEHRVVQTDPGQQALEIVYPVRVGILHDIIVQVKLRVVSMDKSDPAPKISLLLRNRHFSEFVMITELLRMFLHQLYKGCLLFINLLTPI